MGVPLGWASMSYFTKMECPLITQALISYLEKTNTPLEITPTTSIEKIMYESGKQFLIQHLREQYEHQQQPEE